MKVSPEFPIDPGEQIQIEGGGDPRRVIVGQQHVIDRFLDVSPQEKRVARLQMPADVAQKILCCRRIKIADAASEEQDQECLIRPAAGRGFLKPFQIRSFQSDHADCAEMSQFLVALEESRCRHIDGKIGHGLPIRERFQYPAGLSAAAAPQLDHGHGWRKMFDAWLRHGGGGVAARHASAHIPAAR